MMFSYLFTLNTFLLKAITVSLQAALDFHYT